MKHFRYFPWQGPKNHVCSEPRKRWGMHDGSRAQCGVCGQWWVLDKAYDYWDSCWYKFWKKEN